jgi:hypothetical protein
MSTPNKASIIVVSGWFQPGQVHFAELIGKKNPLGKSEYLTPAQELQFAADVHARILAELQRRNVCAQERFETGAHCAGGITDCIFAFEVSDIYKAQGAIQSVFNEPDLNTVSSFFEFAFLAPDAPQLVSYSGNANRKRIAGMEYEQLLSLIRTLNQKASTQANS